MANPLANATLTIASRRLVIRMPTLQDAAACYALLTSPENFPLGQPPEAAAMKPEDLAAHMGAAADDASAGKNAILVFESRETGELVGYGSYNAVEAVLDPAAFLGRATSEKSGALMADVGMLVAFAHRRQGYALEALCALIDHARNDMGCTLFRAETEPVNEPWRTLMRTAGLGAVEAPAKASFDKEKDVVAWTWDVKEWAAAKEYMKVNGK